jgi:hypothetical protein
MLPPKTPITHRLLSLFWPLHAVTRLDWLATGFPLTKESGEELLLDPAYKK